MKEAIWRVESESGAISMRSGLVQTFFLPTPIDSVVGAIRTAFECYVERIPASALRWCSIGAASEEWRPIDQNTMRRCLDQLDPKAAAKRPLTYFELRDGERRGDAPGYGVAVTGHPVDTKFPDKRSVLEFYYPSDCIDSDTVNDFVQQTLLYAEMLPLLAGYASPGLFCTSPDAWRAARAPAKRYPGFDVHDNLNARRQINGKVRGARWLTLLGPDVVNRLGGEAEIRRRLVGVDFTLVPVGAAHLVRISRMPELYDISVDRDITAIRSLARLLEPVTLFEEAALYRTEFAGQDDDRLRMWERRFLDAEG